MNELSPERWSQLWRVAENETPYAECFLKLAGHYSEPHRYYHNQRHIADCLAEFDRVKAATFNPEAVELAIWFHDAVYDTRAGDNEERSAELATRWLQRFQADSILIDAVSRLILATKKHDGSLHPDAPLLVDIDLSILGRPPAQFWGYERQIRAEYVWVEAALFATKRAEILESFLARPRLYQTDHYFKLLETQARENLRASIKQLRSNAP